MSRNISLAANFSENLIDTRNLSERVYDYLTDKIMEGSIAHGKKINPKLIAETLSVSVTPVREAIKRLEVEGILTILPRSNCSVNMPTSSSMLDAFEMREMLEKHAMEKIYSRVKDEDLSNLEFYLKQMDSCLPINESKSRMAEYVKYDQLFHLEFFQLADNSYLLKTYRTNMLRLNIAMTFKAGTQADMKQVNEDHHSIYEHLKNNSPSSVDALMKHLNQCKLNLTSGELFKSLPT